MALRAGDTIFVPRAATVFVTGPGQDGWRVRDSHRDDRSPGAGARRRRDRPRLDAAHADHPSVDEGKEVTLDVNLQTPVQPGDTIVVRERFM